ncbi:MAG: cell division protein SepF [Oscillospiraceae bacterium]|nr:cell division protein SepF [Oscillospiraceae bacterium]
MNFLEFFKEKLGGGETYDEHDEHYEQEQSHGHDVGGFDGSNALKPKFNDDLNSGVRSNVLRFTESNPRTHKVIRFKGTEYNLKRKEAAKYFKEGHVVYINMEEANKEILWKVLDFLAGTASALDGNIKMLANNVWAVIPRGDEIGGDIYEEEAAEHSSLTGFDWH